MSNTKRCSSNRRKRARSVADDEWRGNGVLIEKRSCWSDLPSDLLEPITSKLFFADQINFRAVCKSWNSINRVSPLKQMPWLMCFDDIKGKHSWDSCKLVDPTSKKTYTIDMSSINKKKNLKDCIDVKIHESKFGWLLMSCVSNETSTSHSLFLYSPFFIDNNNIIELPVLDTKDYIATFDLNLTKYGKQDFEVLILRRHNGWIDIGTCRPGDNKWSWKKPALGEFSISKPLWEFSISDTGTTRVYSEGIFYYANFDSYHIVSGSYDVVQNKWTKFKGFSSVLEPIMIKLDGEIFLISTFNMRSRPCWGSMCGYLDKLDVSKGTWVGISRPNLGDRALFLGDGYSMSLELDDDIVELKDQKQKLYYCYGSVLKHCNSLGKNISSYSCSKHYGSLARGKLFCRRLWIDPPRRPHIRNSL